MLVMPTTIIERLGYSPWQAGLAEFIYSSYVIVVVRNQTSG